MSDSDYTEDKIGYGKLVNRSMHNIIYQALKIAETGGLPGNHHFFISFLTKAKGVRLSEKLINKYPSEMTIVLQYQFENLKVSKNKMSVTLSFDGIPENLEIPYSAMISFADPSADFGLRFNPDDNIEGEPVLDLEEFEEDSESIKTPKVKDKESPENQKVISLDKFRKKNKKKDQ